MSRSQLQGRTDLASPPRFWTDLSRPPSRCVLASWPLAWIHHSLQAWKEISFFTDGPKAVATLGGLGAVPCRRTLGSRGGRTEQVVFTSHASGGRVAIGARPCARCHRGPPGWVRGRPDPGAEKKTNTDVFGWDSGGRKASSPPPHPTPHRVRAGPAPSPGFPPALLSLSLCLYCSLSGSQVPTRSLSPSGASRAGWL